MDGQPEPEVPPPHSPVPDNEPITPILPDPSEAPEPPTSPTTDPDREPAR